jgi:riboflavin biosynthesis pyrimidine reductase
MINEQPPRGNAHADQRRNKLSNQINIVSVGPGKGVDLAAAAQLLRQKHGIRTLLCEGGPTLYGELLERQLIDEEFRTISLQVLGESTKPGIDRPTTYGNVSYTPETAPWFRLISIHYALPHHAFFRLRYEGPREFQD